MPSKKTSQQASSTSFAERLIEAMRDAGVTQKELAGRMGLSQQAISRWLVLPTLPNARTLLAIAAALDVETEWIAFGREPKRIESAQGRRVLTLARVKEATLLLTRARSDLDLCAKLLQGERKTIQKKD